MLDDIVIDQAGHHGLASVPDLSGCVATGNTGKETEAQTHEAIAFNQEGLREGGEAQPVPRTTVGTFPPVRRYPF